MYLGSISLMEQIAHSGRCKLKIICMAKKLHLPLLREKPEKMSDEDWALLDKQVLGVI
ncbi:hypothetical protein Patl1_15574 [Pistacia atlantica]|uniref:Uncharacterized protein n=1 Tax=Pistacia atlantica TaxID=434234 RepID=A0ACC1B5S8_9ROSI|nr:hypothetical protein Patl1_15574 [Pistacia atlantica]